MIINLTDDRRKAKPWLPEDDRDVTSGLVTKGALGKPSCKWHGSMNRIDQYRSLWRCSEMRCGVGAEVVTIGEFVKRKISYLLHAKKEYADE